MFGLTDKLKSAAAAGGTMAAAIALAILGVVWVSIALYMTLASWFAPPLAMLAVGGLAMAPLAVMLVRRRAAAQKAPEPEEPVPQTAFTEEASAVVRLAQSAARLAERHPLAGVALTLGAAVMASRNQATAPFAMHLLAEAVERWAAQPPDEASPEPEAGPSASDQT